LQDENIFSISASSGYQVLMALISTPGGTGACAMAENEPSSTISAWPSRDRAQSRNSLAALGWAAPLAIPAQNTVTGTPSGAKNHLSGAPWAASGIARLVTSGAIVMSPRIIASTIWAWLGYSVGFCAACLAQ